MRAQLLVPGLNLNAQEWKEMNHENKHTTLELCLSISSLNNPGVTVLQPKNPVAPIESLVVGVQTGQNTKAMPNYSAASFTRAEPATVISSDATPEDNDAEATTPQTTDFKSRGNGGGDKDDGSDNNSGENPVNSGPEFVDNKEDLTSNYHQRDNPGPSDDPSDRTLLTFIDEKRDLFLDTDASDFGCGGCLYHDRMDEDNTVIKEPITFLGHMFSSSQLNWATIDIETFAIYDALCSLEPRLLGHQFVIRTDHRNLVFMANCTNRRVQKYHLFLNNFDYTIEHIKGKDNKIADPISRLMLNLIFPSLRDCIVESEISGTNMLSAVANMLPAENPEPDEDILVQEMQDLQIPDTLDNPDAPTLIEAFERDMKA